MDTSNRSDETDATPQLEAGTVSVEVVPDLRKLRSLAVDLIKLIDRYSAEDDKHEG